MIATLKDGPLHGHVLELDGRNRVMLPGTMGRAEVYRATGVAGDGGASVYEWEPPDRYSSAISAARSWGERTLGPENVIRIDAEPDAAGVEITLVAFSPKKQADFYIKFYIADAMMQDAAMPLSSYIRDLLSSQYKAINSEKYSESMGRLAMGRLWSNLRSEAGEWDPRTEEHIES